MTIEYYIILKDIAIEKSIRFWQTWLVAADPQNCRFVDALGLTCSRKRWISSLSSWLSFLHFHCVMFWQSHSGQYGHYDRPAGMCWNTLEHIGSKILWVHQSDRTTSLSSRHLLSACISQDKRPPWHLKCKRLVKCAILKEASVDRKLRASRL